MNIHSVEITFFIAFIFFAVQTAAGEEERIKANTAITISSIIALVTLLIVFSQ